ncbi:hypothetical protein HPB48_011836 [Haemaphysalis longicornis]|uniref:Uncharacterized protein n=1 Tax=Haemaphysalis longicornis TaxID=44386 RepID=A0A9J6FWB7_HAELO|nr:hypothetical protein HPB48_011836 [Haemaphysalis longicornis]
MFRYDKRTTSGPALDATRFRLFTRQNPHKAQFLIASDRQSILNSSFSAKWDTKVYVHGYLNSGKLLAPEMVSGGFPPTQVCGIPGASVAEKQFSQESMRSLSGWRVRRWVYSDARQHWPPRLEAARLAKRQAGVRGLPATAGPARKAQGRMLRFRRVLRSLSSSLLYPI